MCKLVGPIMQQLGGFVDDLCAIRVALFLPTREAGGCEGELVFQLLVHDFGERLHNLGVKRVDALVFHLDPHCMRMSGHKLARTAAASPFASFEMMPGKTSMPVNLRPRHR